ncbi:hypothetical protein BGZ47_002165 [Haplosporangium gracile]|nr:hypothetical protein BGZ47_002165 [Haplosporangium gracile]
MGAGSYDFVSITAAAIPVPKEALQRPFDLQGFKLMTVQVEHYDDETKDYGSEYHGALICLADTELAPTSIVVIGPYEIMHHQAECKRMKHLEAFMPAETRDRLASAFETYTGRKPDVVSGFWTVSASSSYSVDLWTTWSLEELDRIVDGRGDRFCFIVERDADGSHA